MFLHKLTDWLRKRPEVKTPKARLSTRLRLEQLEDRLTPSFTGTAWTYTNAVVKITPNLGAFNVTETVTATVTTTPFFNPTNGVIHPVPTGAGTPTGTVLFNLNNQTQSVTLNASGQATATFTLPLLSLFTSQALEVGYQGVIVSPTSNFAGSTFLSPLYRNFDNVFLPATLTFGLLTPQQEFANVTFSNTNSSTPTTLPQVFYTAQGETDSLGGGLIAFNYLDPGTINTVTVFGRQLPGIFAIQLGAYGGISASSSSSSNS